MGPVEDVHEWRRNRRRYGGRYGRYGYEDSDEDEDSEPGGHHLEFVVETELVSKLVFDFSGNRIASLVPLDEEDILQEDAFGDMPDQEDYEGYMVSFT